MRRTLVLCLLVFTTAQAFAGSGNSKPAVVVTIPAKFQPGPGHRPYPWHGGGGPAGNVAIDWNIWYGKEEE